MSTRPFVGSDLRAPRCPARHGRGFSLLELLIALGILVVGMTGVYGVYLSATRQHARAVDSTNVAVAALGLLETARVAVAKEPTLDLTKVQKGSVPGMEGYAYEMRFSKMDDQGLRVLVELTLIWKRRGQAKEHHFRTVALRQELPKGRR